MRRRGVEGREAGRRRLGRGAASWVVFECVGGGGFRGGDSGSRELRGFEGREGGGAVVVVVARSGWEAVAMQWTGFRGPDICMGRTLCRTVEARKEFTVWNFLFGLRGHNARGCDRGCWGHVHRDWDILFICGRHDVCSHR